jgi:hypothetical protein
MMNAKKLVAACLFAALLTLTGAPLVSAHQTVSAGPYDIEIGWLDEPPILGQMNAVVMNLSARAGSTSAVPADISGLTLTVSYGGQSKILTLQPLGEDTPGQFMAPLLPTVAGLYTVDVTGRLGTTDVKVEVQPEEVQPAEAVQFPQAGAAPAASGFGLTGWLALAGLACGLAALVLAVLALRKPR